MQKLKHTKIENLLTIDPKLGILLYELNLMADGYEVTLGAIKKYVIKTYLYEADIFTRTRIVRRLNDLYGSEWGILGQVAVLLNDSLTLQINHPSNLLAVG